MRRTQTDADESERAVSPVIGVILMIAITVILAAVIATLVMDFGEGSSPGPSAQVEVTENGSAADVQLHTVNRLDGWNAGCSGSVDPTEDPDVGSVITVPCSPENVTVVGTYEGSEGTLPH